eukprot:COSAG05_NODE_275_length_12406_cov_12.621841_4_plen_80_part_00
MRVIHSIARGRREAGDGSLMAPDEAMCISMYHGTCWFLFCLDLRVAAATIVEGTPFDLAGNARIQNVGRSRSRMVSNYR